MTALKNDILCPKCKGFLNIDEHVVFITRSKKWKGGLIFLNPEVGNYQVTHHPAFHFEEGEKIEFICPICHKNLSSRQHENLAQIIMRDEKNQEFEILFSQIAGEHSTYKIIGDHVSYYGEHGDNYIDFLNLSTMT